MSFHVHEQAVVHRPLPIKSWIDHWKFLNFWLPYLLVKKMSQILHWFADFLKFPPHISDILQVLSDQTMKCTATSCRTEQFFIGKSDRSDSFQELWFGNFFGKTAVMLKAVDPKGLTDRLHLRQTNFRKSFLYIWLFALWTNASVMKNEWQVSKLFNLSVVHSF